MRAIIKWWKKNRIYTNSHTATRIHTNRVRTTSAEPNIKSSTDFAKTLKTWLNASSWFLSVTTFCSFTFCNRPFSYKSSKNSSSCDTYLCTSSHFWSNKYSSSEQWRAWMVLRNHRKKMRQEGNPYWITHTYTTTIQRKWSKKKGKKELRKNCIFCKISKWIAAAGAYVNSEKAYWFRC